MKKTWKNILCAILLAAVAVSAVACKNGTQDTADDPQTEFATAEEVRSLRELLEQQQRALQELKELCQQQQEKNEALERQYAELSKTVQKLQAALNTLQGVIPYQVSAVATSHFSWERGKTAYLIRTQAQLERFLDDLDAEFENPFEFPWILRTADGTTIDKDYFYGKDLSEKALVVTVFLSPCLSAEVTDHRLWKDGNKLHAEVTYTHGISTAVETVMVVMEVDQADVSDVEEIVLQLN